MFKSSLYTSIAVILFLFFEKIKYFYFYDNDNCISYNKLMSLAKENKVKEILLNEKQISIINNLGNAYKTNGFFLNKKLIGILLNNHIKLHIEQGETHNNYLSKIFLSWLPVFLFILFLIYTIKYYKYLNKKKYKLYKKKIYNKNINFSDIIGYNEIKEELKEIIFFLKNSKKFIKMGGNIPKGILLIGAPGTGKTLLAKAIANEANVPFLNFSGSSFIEVFVGIGASRIRKIFENAKKKSPCIIFIDEIDSIGKKRGINVNNNNDEREQTLNQLLIEMDGFKINSKIIVIAATNRPEILDKALLRPGRFDKKIIIDLPNIKERQQILSFYIKKLLTADNIRIDYLSKNTMGLSCADLSNLVNDAVLIAIKNNQKIIEMKNLEEAKEKILLGPKKDFFELNKNDRKNIAYHEAGHIIVTKFLLKNDNIYKVTIIPRGYSLGMIWNFQENNINHIYKKNILINITILLAGRISEKMFLKKISSGASNDFKKATKLAKNIVTNYGMSKILGVRVYKNINNKIHSEFIKKKIDKEVNNILKNQYKLSKDILQSNQEMVILISNFLLKWETINLNQINDILLNKKPKPPKFYYSKKYFL